MQILNKDLLLARREGALRRAREIVLNALESAIYSVDSYSSTRKSIKLEKELSIVNSRWNPSKGEIHVVGAGKAGAKMALAVEDSLGDLIRSGVVNVLKGTERTVRTRRIELIPAGHPLPDSGSIEGARRILRLAEKLGKDDLLLVLISGGGSAIMELPQEGISLDDLIKMNKLLISCGADIREINTVRKHVSRVKGGRLAKVTKA
ncbi:MAG: glycerate kinase, partial [Thermoproteota archaeon]